jgi:hypothetical protein
LIFSEIKKIYFERQRNFLNNLQKVAKFSKNNNAKKEPKDEKKKTPRKKSTAKLVADTPPNNPTPKFESNNNLDDFNDVLNMIAKNKYEEVSSGTTPPTPHTASISRNNLY